MCGIAGFCDFRGRSTPEDLERMTDILWHRGPDSAGYRFFTAGNVHVGLGHRRLSIIDLSERGSQPLGDERGEHLVVFNGEIYNYREIRAELERRGHVFSSSSDTEVLLRAYLTWGVDAVHRLIGMFAFAIYDRKADKILLFRDRAGVKPLYYHHKNGLFLFASELKSFTQLAAFPRKLDERALPLYFKYGYYPAPYTVFEDTYKLEPGHYLELDLRSKELKETKYWDVCDYYNMSPLQVGEAEATEELESLLASAFKYRLVADVPVGVFLSGGYDSTAVAAILQEDMTERLKTFTIGFPDERFDEAPEARAIARHLGTDHTEHYCSAADVRTIIDTLPYYYDEPFIDSSAIATMLVSKLARERVTVALSADGGDETFAGYDHFEERTALLERIKRTPRWLKRPVGAVADRAASATRAYGGRHKHALIAINQLWKLRSSMSCSDMTDVVIRGGKCTDYRIYRLLGTLPDATGTRLAGTRDWRPGLDDLSKCMAIDYQNNMADDMLTKVDRGTMSVSLEGREPLLDHRIIEFVARLPLAYKYEDGVRKKILKRIVHRRVPRQLLSKRKKGFGVPVARILRRDLPGLFAEHLDERRLDDHGLFDADYVAHLRARYQEDGSEYPLLWSLLMFQMWYGVWMQGRSPTVERPAWPSSGERAGDPATPRSLSA